MLACPLYWAIVLRHRRGVAACRTRTIILVHRESPMWLTFLLGCMTALFLGSSMAALFHSQWARRLPSLEALSRESGGQDRRERLPSCSVVVAARDEELRIEGTVRRLLALQGVELEIIVVDDRSVDGTGEILRRLSADESRLRCQRVESLPDGWLGKCYACHVGAASATGEWILFTDADCWLKPDVLIRALLVAAREQADHITMTPGVAAVTVGAQAWHIAFLISLANWISGVNRDQPKSYLGIGAFNLVRRAAYEACGGYTALRLTVVDDVKLGLLLRRAEKRTRGFIGGGDAECHWGTTVASMIKIMEKNYFAAIDYRLAAVVALDLAAILMFAITVTGPFTANILGWFPGFAHLSMVIPAAVFARRLGWSYRGAALVPFVLPLLVYALTRSTYVTIRQGGIRWRGTFYRLEALRKGNVQ